MKNKNVGWKRLLSLLLVVVLVVQIVPLQVLAEEIDTKDDFESINSVNNPELEEEVELKQSTIVGEVSEKREENVKHFFNSDGSYTAVQYSQAVHYKQPGSDEWKDIDNTLSLKASRVNGESEKSYVPESSPLDVELADNYAVAKPVTYRINGYEISWHYEYDDVKDDKSVDGKNIIAKKREKEPVPESKNSNDSFIILDKLGDGIVYSDVYPNVDIEYSVYASELKENIVLKEKTAPNEYTIVYNIGELKAEQKNEHEISVIEPNGKAVFTIAAPYMADAKGNSSSAVSVKIVDQDENCVKVSIAADKEWLQSDERSYPVKIDPWFYDEVRNFDQDATAIYKNISSSQRPYGTMVVGYDGGYSYTKAKAYVKFTLPTLHAGDVVTSSILRLRKYSGDYGYSGTASSANINVYRVTSSWTAAQIESSHSYSGLPTRNTTVVDYATVGYSSSGENKDFNITKVTKMWYDETVENYGLCLMAENETASALTCFIASDNTAYPQYRPMLLVNYRNSKGLEGYWSNHEQNLGESGVGYVNDYTGNFVFVAPLVSTAGNNMPLSLSLVYNGYLAGKASGFATKCGNGWMLSIQNKLTKIEENGSDLEQRMYDMGYRYIYSDSDGTDHYLVLDDNNKIVDEDGLGLTLNIYSAVSSDSEKYALEGDDGSKITFLSNGNIRCFYSSDYNADLNNRIKVFYNTLNDGIIKYIKDGVGRKTSFTYDSNNKITEISDPSGRTIVFTYAENATNLLSKISYPDGTYTSFLYTTSKLYKIRSRDGMRLKYTYPDTGTAAAKSRVIGIAEYNRNDGGAYSDANIGNSLTIDYSKMNRTRFTDNQGRKETYTFDNAGRTINVFDASGGAGMYSYQSSNTTGRKSNTLTASSQTEKFVDNLLRNHSFESGTTAWGLSENTASISTDKYYLGNKSMHLNAAGRVGQIIKKTSGTYNISAYIVGTSTSSQAKIHAICYNSSGTVISTISSGKFSLGTTWSRVFFPFTLPSGTAYFRARIENSGTNDIWVDCVQVESGAVMNAYNLVVNGGFENTESTAWVASHCTDDDGYVDDTSYGRSLRIYGATSALKRYYQNIYINKVAKNVHFSISGLAYANSVPLTSNGDGNGRNFSLEIRTVFEDESVDPIVQTQSFNADCGGIWQFTSGTMGYNASNIRNKTIKYIQIRCSYFKNANYATFDHIQVNLDETGTAYTYDNEGNLITAKDNAGRNQSYSYSSANEITSATTADNKNYTYTYGTTYKHRLVSATSNSSDIKFSYGYDGYGNVTQTTVRKSDGTGPYIRQYTTYTDDISSDGARNYSGNYVKTSGDDWGKNTTYEYNLLKGTLKNVTDPKGNVTRYTYNANNDRLLTVSADGSTVNYNYNTRGELTKITTPVTDNVNGASSTEYSFTYDAFGNSVSTKAGNHTLVTNAYNPNNGTLSTQTYGNGDCVSYTYDNLDRETARKYNGTTRFKWKYNALGQVGIYTDNVTGKEYYYAYDDIGRLVRTEVSDGSWFKTSYNTIDLATQLKYHYAGITRNITYAYSDRDNLPLSTTFADTKKVKNTYDDLGRITKKSYDETASSNNEVKAEYSYKTVTGDRTTSRIASIAYTTHGGLPIDNLFYKYDNNGNITNIYAGTDDTGTHLEHYTYDSKNQLIRNNSSVQGKTYLYTYDAAGNITAVKEFEYTTAASSTLADSDASSIKTYTYGDASWGDLLTSYNGQSIVYDTIGNPTSYLGWTMDWEGRRLVSAENGDNTLSYTYDASGIRTSKTVNGVTTEYLLNGTQILAQKTGNETLWFIYDSEGNRIGITRRYIYNGSYTDVSFYYIYNQQGDVIALAKASNGQIVARYDYDAWGNCSVTKAAGFEIGDINPFRYRGYYYDTDTGLYYLNSRYYDAETGRFINVDAFATTNIANPLSANMFAYCENNPVICYDSSGLYSFLCTELGGNPVTAKTFADDSKKNDSKYREIASVSTEGGLGVYIGVKTSLIEDDEGNCYLATTYKIGGGVGANVEAPKIRDLISYDTMSAIDVDNIHDLQGWSYSMGGTIAVVGIEWDGSTNPLKLDWSISASMGLDFHLTGNYTVIKRIYKSK